MTTINKTKPVYNLKEQLKLFFSISLGIYLLILFFQPFGNIRPDINEKLLYNAGLAGITYFMMWIFRIMIPLTFPKFSDFEKWNIDPKTISYALIWFFNALAFVFYIRYVGPLRMSMYLIFKISLISLVPIIVLSATDTRKSLNQLLQALIEKNKKLTAQLSDSEEKAKAIEVIASENKSEIIKLQIDDLVLIKSADNYVEILYNENEKIQQKLIRNTLKNIEAQLKKYSDIIRCHRTYIVNKKYVRDFTRGYTGYRLKLSGYNEEIPVSRQYLLLVKDAIIST
ncbi:MAG: response regulator transcription factor [Bacteroidales bacterium]|nr:response regulator transcription factor [Bacteroidales bacterium]